MEEGEELEFLKRSLITNARGMGRLIKMYWEKEDEKTERTLFSVIQAHIRLLNEAIERKIILEEEVVENITLGLLEAKAQPIEIFSMWKGIGEQFKLFNNDSTSIPAFKIEPYADLQEIQKGKVFYNKDTTTGKITFIVPVNPNGRIVIRKCIEFLREQKKKRLQRVESDLKETQS